MKKLLLVIMTIALALAFICCGEESVFEPTSTPESTVESVTQSQPPAHTHDLAHYSFKDATCKKEGNIEYWRCHDCYKLFADEDATVEISDDDTTVAKKPHSLVHYEAIEAVADKGGQIEYWQCSSCEQYYSDENGTKRIGQGDIAVAAPFSVVDFVVKVPTDRQPVVLQLTDPQIIDASQARPGRPGVNTTFWAKDQIEERCYNFFTEIINAVKPDLIIITGDIIYGEFDDSGSAMLSFVEFMESFNIPWAPVFGNHDNESAKGADWQCQQYENAKNCLFKQRTLTGNGNYSVGIAQGDSITRVFYMLDSNGCANASKATIDNGHTKTTAGFASDQIAWYTSSINAVKNSYPSVKISMAYHIQQYTFNKIYSKYGVVSVNNLTKNPVNIDSHPDKAATDFGYLGGNFSGEWDFDETITNGMAALGVDSVFIGHEHLNSASVVYNGIRFQFGQKSSEYDKFGFIKNGVRGGDYYKPAGATSIVGGSVIPLNASGEIVNPYIYYCGDIFDTNPKNA